MERFRTRASAASLAASPLLILAYWLTYPAYGEINSERVVAAVHGDPSMTGLADLFAFFGALLAVPASFALMRALTRATPALAWLGGSLSALGWVAVSILLMTDVLAIEIAQQGVSASSVQLFKNVTTNPLVIALTVTASLHVVGAVLIGIALVRSRLIPRGLAIAATGAPLVHVAANLSGVLWLDSITWLVLAMAYGFVIPVILGQWSSGATQAPPSVDVMTSTGSLTA
jgi:hypothetical protein